MHHWEPQQFFEPYLPQRYCPDRNRRLEAKSRHHCRYDTYEVPRVYAPPLSLRGGGPRDLEAYASTTIGDQTIEYHLGVFSLDITRWKGETTNFIENFQGRIGNRLLHVLFRRFIEELRLQTKNAGYSCRAKVLREKRPFDRPEGHLVRSRGDPIDPNRVITLKYDRHTTLKLLHQIPRHSDRFGYDPDVDWDELSEMDGMAYYLAAKQERVYRAIIIAEVKTGTNPRAAGWETLARDAERGVLHNKMFEPLRMIYPEDKFFYLIVGYPSALFEQIHPRIIVREPLVRLIDSLYSSNVFPLIAVFPPEISCTTLAEHFKMIMDLDTVRERGRRG